MLAAPEDMKKRNLRKANEAFHRKVGRHAAAVDFLVGVGFTEIDDPDTPGQAGRNALLAMPVAYLSRLTDAHHTLALVAQRGGVVAPPLPSNGFNPYRAGVQKTDMSNGVVGAKAWRDKTERLHNEVKMMQQELQQKVEAAPSVELRPTAFWLAGGRRLEEVIRETAKKPAEDPSTDHALLMQFASSKVAASGAKDTFESADKRRLAELSRARVHDTCVLRVIFPDKSVLQANFRAGDKGDHVMAHLGPLLAPHVRKASWYIYQSPPMKRLSSTETLSAAGLTPGANMYLGFEGERPAAPYLISSLVSQLGPLPREGQHGSSAIEPPILLGSESANWGKGMTLGGTGSTAGSATRSASFRSTSFSAKTGEQMSGSTASNPRWFRQSQASGAAIAKDTQGHPKGVGLEQSVVGKPIQSAGYQPSDSSTRAGGPRSPDGVSQPLVELQDAAVSPGWFFSCMPSCYAADKAKVKR